MAGKVLRKFRGGLPSRGKLDVFLRILLHIPPKKSITSLRNRALSTQRPRQHSNRLVLVLLIDNHRFIDVESSVILTDAK